MPHAWMSAAAALAACTVGVVLACLPAEAHKAITSRYTYNEDIEPIFARRCGHCHVEGGVGPMSLVTYQEAFPWAESLRAELLTAEDDERPGGDFILQAHRSLTARELDMVLDWAVGGTPEGSSASTPAPVVLRNDWPRGTPDLVLQPPAPVLIPADAMEMTHELVLPIPSAVSQSVAAVDLLPGAPAVVRDAALLLRSPNNALTVLGTWTPSQSPAPIAVAPAATLHPGAEIMARIHYKKTWKYEGQAMSDRSAIGIYFAK